MSNANIIAIFKDTSLTVTIDVRTISDNALIINSADMTEMSDGAYKYIFTSYDESLDYLFICKANNGDRVFATNDSVSDLTKTAAELDRKLSTNKASITVAEDGTGIETVTIYDDDNETEIHKHTVSADKREREPV